MYEGRACFLNKFPGNKSYTFELPIFVENSPYPLESRKVELDMEGVIEELVNLEWEKPDAPPFELLRTYFMNPEVCMTSLAFEGTDLIGLEQQTRNYNTLPFDGGLLDQPTVLLQAFDVISSERNHWERIRMERTNRDMKKQQMQQKAKMNQGPQGPPRPIGKIPMGGRR
tara:strand:+ start:1803 stop:2312 length:510 start_codon:yes stop_codon:yes gene_type:complete